jgi:KipI family sensor histidine kinase inhibitor
MNIRFAGESALLVELPDFNAAHALRRQLLSHPRSGILEVVPGYESLLIEFDPLRIDAETFAADVALYSPDDNDRPEPVLHEIDVHYDGPDLQAVAEESGLTVAEVIQRHSEARYTVAFLGFAPGFPYLVGLDPALRVARLKTPRTRVPTGAVAIADQFAGIYPQATPGGWRLLGHTDAVLFDTARTVPALIAPGDRVQFRKIA